MSVLKAASDVVKAVEKLPATDRLEAIRLASEEIKTNINRSAMARQQAAQAPQAAAAAPVAQAPAEAAPELNMQ